VAASRRSQVNFEVDEETFVALKLTAVAEDTSVPSLVRTMVEAQLAELLSNRPKLRESVESMLQDREETAASTATVTDLRKKDSRSGDGSA
jgi:hypothetical protein